MMLSYLAKKREEGLKRIRPSHAKAYHHCWDLIVNTMICNNSEIDTRFVRRVEILEALVVGFLEIVDSDNVDSLEFAENKIFSLSGR